jgi:hypothetical protein
LFEDQSVIPECSTIMLLLRLWTDTIASSRHEQYHAVITCPPRDLKHHCDRITDGVSDSHPRSSSLSVPPANRGSGLQ